MRTELLTQSCRKEEDAMSRIGTIVVVYLLLGVACSCASQTKTRTSSANAPAGVDVEYMRAVEHRARIAGVDVRWINAPTKYRSKTDD
ncbi:MAG: hypothetical protein COZ47_07225 [Lysobacterales bacterium CG_4_10_14_3_um_filter_64_11]|nr:MAG: hypothetical protein COZ47_07225 [Xanthomonadales bacterium CG_4_10_14_3_um_filter_64_11]